MTSRRSHSARHRRCSFQPPLRRSVCPQKASNLNAFSATRTWLHLIEVKWELRTAEITDDTGKAFFKQENIEVPASWSPLATKIAVSKYFYGDVAKGTDPYKGGRERSVKQLIHRVTRTITDWGMKDGYFADKDSADDFSTTNSRGFA